MVLCECVCGFEPMNPVPPVKAALVGVRPDDIIDRKTGFIMEDNSPGLEEIAGAEKAV